MIYNIICVHYYLFGYTNMLYHNIYSLFFSILMNANVYKEFNLSDT